MKRALVALAAAALALCGAGCQELSDMFKNDGSDAGCDGGGPTLVQQCTSVYTEYCNQAATRCGLSVPSDCASQATMAHCPCAVENCDASSCNTAPLVTSCEQALDTADCNTIVNAFMGAWPAECQPFQGQAQ